MDSVVVGSWQVGQNRSCDQAGEGVRRGGWFSEGPPTNRPFCPRCPQHDAAQRNIESRGEKEKNWTRTVVNVDLQDGNAAAGVSRI